MPPASAYAETDLHTERTRNASVKPRAGIPTPLYAAVFQRVLQANRQRNKQENSCDRSKKCTKKEIFRALKSAVNDIKKNLSGRRIAR